MKLLGRVVAAALLPALAAAQQATLAPSPALACLSPATAVAQGPDYPFMPLKRELAGRVSVELEFAGPELAPAVRILAQEAAAAAAPEFVAAVRAHVRQFRVPCMKVADGPVRLVQDYVFAPDKRRVLWSDPVDLQDARRQQQLRCVQHQSGRRQPDYPRDARRYGVQGRLIARLRFDGADQPPQAEIFARPSAQLLHEEVERWVRGLRMPCHGSEPVTGEWHFFFVMENEAYGFKPLSLTQLLGSVKGIDRQALQIDTTAMNCPFELRFTYRQPALPNRVGEVTEAAAGGSALAVPMAGPDPARRPLVDWLKGVELTGSSRILDSIFGDTALVTVPCLKIDLKPKE